MHLFLQVQLQQNENVMLTKALVEVKVAYAEKDSEFMRLAQVVASVLRNCQQGALA